MSNYDVPDLLGKYWEIGISSDILLINHCKIWIPRCLFTLKKYLLKIKKIILSSVSYEKIFCEVKIKDYTSMKIIIYHLIFNIHNLFLIFKIFLNYHFINECKCLLFSLLILFFFFLFFFSPSKMTWRGRWVTLVMKRDNK